jgi:large subunit ribosomal protein L9
MELILTKDVENLGFKDEVVTVKPGYGRNFLIPQGFAKLATASAKKVLAENLRQRAHKEKEQIEEATKMVESLKDVEISISAKVGQGNKLFGSINNIDVANALAKKGFEVDKRYIQIYGGTVKTVGKHEAKIRLHREVSTEFEFEVVAEKKK